MRANDLALAKFEIRDGFAGLGRYRLLTGDRSEILNHVSDLVLIEIRAEARIDRNLHNSRNLMRVSISTTFSQSRDYLFLVVGLESGSV